jgi:hypothetical protein
MIHKLSMMRRGGVAFTVHTSALILTLWAGGAIAASAPNPPVNVCAQGYGCAPDDEPIKGSGIKWHPGHYAETQTYGSVPDAVITDISRVSAIRGVTQRYNWSSLEPKRGLYNFTAISADLAKLRPHGKRLILLLMDRSWSGTSTAHLPAYLLSESGTKGIYTHPVYGPAASTWREPIMDRLIALNAALAAKFDSEPLFEGMRFEEITPGMTPGDSGVPGDYTVPDMIRQWNRLATAAKLQWKRTNVFLNTNTLGGAAGPLEIIEHAYKIGGVGVGGPDVLPPGAGDYQIAGDRVIARRPNAAKGDNAAAFLRDYRGQLPVAHSVQTPELGGKEGTFMPTQLADYAILQVGNTHMSWVVAPSTVKINWKGHILPYLSAKPRQTLQSCPKRYVSGCTTN